MSFARLSKIHDVGWAPAEAVAFGQYGGRSGDDATAAAQKSTLKKGADRKIGAAPTQRRLRDAIQPRGRSSFVAYAAVYGYIGISSILIRDIRDEIALLGYFVVTGAAMLILLIVIARRFGKEA